MFSYEYERPSITTDVIVHRDGKVLLIRRKNEPYKGMFALPGGYMEMDETLAESAARELREETGIVVEPDKLEFMAFGDNPKRDTRGRVVTAFFRINVDSDTRAIAGDDAEDIEWLDFDLLKNMDIAFDHKQFILSSIVMNHHKSPYSKTIVKEIKELI